MTRDIFDGYFSQIKKDDWSKISCRISKLSKEFRDQTNRKKRHIIINNNRKSISDLNCFVIHNVNEINPGVNGDNFSADFTGSAVSFIDEVGLSLNHWILKLNCLKRKMGVEISFFDNGRQINQYFLIDDEWLFADYEKILRPYKAQRILHRIRNLNLRAIDQ